MADLGQWLQAHLPALIDVATERLSDNENLKHHLAESIEAFFVGLHHAVQQESLPPLEELLRGWVRLQYNPTEDAPTSGLVPVLAILKQVVWEHILATQRPGSAPDLLAAADAIFTEAIVSLTHFEAYELLHRLTAELEEARADLRRLDMSKSNFIAVAAHELRTPLTVAEGYVSILREQADSSQTAILVDGVDSGLKRLHEIVADMLDVSRIDLNLLTLNFQPVLLHQVIEIVERDIERALTERRLNFRVEWSSIPREVTVGDPTYLHRALMKVLFNAIKYTPDGGDISIRGRSLQGFMDVMIEDSGIGIDAENLTYIFDAFASTGDIALHSSSKTKFKGGGPGLGLCIAKGIIEAHGGTIWAESPGYDEAACPGSIFHIMIPIGDEPPDYVQYSEFASQPT